MFSEHLNLSTLNSLLRSTRLGKAPGWANEVWDSIDSTNSRALELAKQAAAEGVVVGARQQSAGRGRLGRTWSSAADCGLYLSVLLRPQLEPNCLPLLSFAAGVATVQAIDKTCGIAVQLKWVNDIIHGGKKIGGILAESASAGTSQNSFAVVIGIGLNLRRPSDLPEDLSKTSGWLEEVAQRPIDANQLAANLLQCLELLYDSLAGNADQQVLTLWRKHSITLGKQIKVIRGNEEFEGTAQDIAGDGALQVLLSSGQIVSVHAADVSIRNVDGSYV
jgi:BirA family biotin operon repressor/biotin-[acetyl-CoA-carboxylase] ligase